MKLIDSFRRSAAQLRDLRSLTGASLLLALSILLTYFFRLDFGGSLSVGLSFNATALMGMLFGPVVTGLANGLGDIIKCVLKPQGPYFFGYTFNAMLAGVIYGVFLYGKSPPCCVWWQPRPPSTSSSTPFLPPCGWHCWAARASMP